MVQIVAFLNPCDVEHGRQRERAGIKDNNKTIMPTEDTGYFSRGMVSIEISQAAVAIMSHPACGILKLCTYTLLVQT